MRTIALRFSDQFAPQEGTIKAHQALIDRYGSVWFGKLGLPVSEKAVGYICQSETPKILLIHSGKAERYWAYINTIQRESPPSHLIPEYYRNKSDRFHTWFHVLSFEKADKDILSKYIVISSGQLLSSVSRSSMSPYFIVEYEDN